MDRLCKGLWIPTDLWESTLSWEAKILFIEIDSRTCEGKDLPLSISDIADFLCVSKSKAKEAISSLISIGKVIRTRKEKEVSYYQSCPLFASIPTPREEILPQSCPKSEPREVESLSVRQIRFLEECKKHEDTYGEYMINKFYSYWSEPNRSQTKMKWEMERTWDIMRRLQTWADRAKVTPRTEQPQQTAVRSFDEIFGLTK